MADRGEKQTKTNIIYFTDIEGDWRRFESAFDGEFARLEDKTIVLSDGAMLVFGGDAVDRGPSSRAIIRCLLEAKKKYGERVVLLGGNRDVNKWRLGTELEPLRGPRLVREVAYIGGRLVKRVTGKENVTEDDVRDFIKKTPRAEILREIFQFTMGAPGAFEFLREELAREQNVALTAIKDEDVADAYLADVKPGGVLHEYLKRTQAAFVHGSTLFVHGGITKENLGFVPSPQGGVYFKKVTEWVENLNAWYAAQTERLATFGHDDESGRLGEELVRYQAPVPGTPKNDKSVIYGRLAQNNPENSIDPLLPDDETCSKLTDNGIAVVVFGHTPQGAAPTPVISADKRVAFVVMDASHDRHHHSPHLRVSSDATGSGGSATMRTRVHRDGEMQRLSFTLSQTQRGLSLDPLLVGMKTQPEGFRVKGVFEDGAFYLSMMDRHYRVHEKVLRPDELSKETFVVPR